MQMFKHSSNYAIFFFAYNSAWKYETHIQLLNTQLCECFPKPHDKIM